MPFRRAVLIGSLRAVDLASVTVCFAVSCAVVGAPALPPTVADVFQSRIEVHDVIGSVALLAVWHAVVRTLGLYESKRLVTFRREIAGAVLATTAGAAAVWVPMLALRVEVATAAFLGMFIASSTATVVTSRVLLRAVLGWLRRRGRNLRNVLIVGVNARSQTFAKGIAERPAMGYRLVGFVDRREWAERNGVSTGGAPLVAELEDVGEVLRRRVVDEVFVFLPLKSFYSEISWIVRQCEEQGVVVKFRSIPFELRHGQAVPDELDSDPVIAISTGAMRGVPLVAKRVLDVVAAAVLLVALSPLLLAVAALVKLTSPGPVLFVHDRLGLNKRTFPMLKFRTMVADAESRLAALEHLNEADGPVFKIRNDPRITRVGAFLRKTSIDELPQLVNVLLGDLSLVGPRPLPVRDYQGFDQDWHRRRFSVRPGITCLWQISGRSTITFEQWMELDIRYIDTWTLWLDLKILLKTIPAVLRGTGAV